MTAISVVTTQVAPIFPEAAEIFDGIAAEDLNAGDPLYQTSAGKYGKADQATAGKQQFRGLALKKTPSGRPVSILKRGHVAGFDLSGLNPDALAYLGTAALDTAVGGTKTVNCGRVMVLTDNSLTKCLYVEADWLRAW